MMNTDESSSQKHGNSRDLASLSSLGISMVVSTVVGLGLGILLDKWLSTAPYLTLIGFFLGVAAGFRQIVKEIRRLNDAKEKHKEHR